MKKCRCKCRKKAERCGQAMLATTEKDQEIKRLTAERDAALDMVDTFMKTLKIIIREENENA